MSGFLTFAVYALRIASDMPIQSDYIPSVSSYFLSSITYNLLAFFWFIYRNRASTKNEIPKCLEIIGNFLKKVFCLCFPTNKKTLPVTETKKPLKNDAVSISMTNETTKKTKCGFCDRCSDCEAALLIDKDKRKKEVESCLEALNYFFFIILFIALFITQLVIWV
jgi:hypothetical protein